MKKGLFFPTVFVYVFLSVLLARFVFLQNYEFIGYIVVIAFLYYGILVLDRQYDFPLYTVWLFIIWVVFHMLGGMVYVGSVRLYDSVLVRVFDGGGELVILRYDQLIHAYCYATLGIIIFYLLKKLFVKRKDYELVVFSILTACGIGLLNEVVEFGLVLFAHAASTVGGYYNNALDLVFNLLGAIIGVFWVSYKER